MNTRRTTLLIAILLAVGTGWLTLNYISGLQQANQGGGVPTQVLVATQDIPARAPITAQMFKREQRLTSAVEPDAIADPARATGSLALITIPAGSQITTSKIGRPNDMALPVRLQTGMRAVSIAIDKVKGVSGLVQPGDRVDVIAIPPRNGNGVPPAATILRGVRVLALGSTLEYPQATPGPDEQNSTTVTLEVSPKQADLLAMADINTILRLALRSPKEPLRSQATEQLSFGSQAAPTSNGGGGASSAAAAIESRMLTAFTQDRQPADPPAPERVLHSSSSPVEMIVGDRVYPAGTQQ